MQTSKPFINPSNRIAGFKPYFFEILNQEISQLRRQGKDIIRIDMGSPDLPPADFIIDRLVSASRRSDTHGYTPYGGTLAIREAIAAYYLRRFNVELDPQTETLALLGSKEGLFNLSQVLINPGDVALVPDPGYPVYSASCLIAGGEIHTMPLLEKNNYLPDLSRIPAGIAARAKLLWLNYPNNPTGAVATLDFFKQVVDFARKNRILIAHDAPYVDISYDGYVAPSLMQVPGAEEVAVEFNSLSKSYNMGGWRLGMAVGNADVIKYIHTYKSQMDSSHFEPILQAGITALTDRQDWLAARNDIYHERRDIVVDALRKAGFRVETPPAAIYVWAGLPQRWPSSMEFSQQLLDQTGVSTTPGVVFGSCGEGFIRISLGTPTERISEAMRRVVAWVNSR
jgi:LL-diaminopimelate aminotransferase